MVFDDGVDAVGDGQDGAIDEFRRDDFLHVIVRLGVNARCGFVEAYHLGISQHRSRETQHLSLTGGIVASKFFHWGVETEALFADEVLALDVLQNVPQLFIRVLVERVEDVTNCAAEQNGILGNASDGRPQTLERNRRDIDTV